MFNEKVRAALEKIIDHLRIDFQNILNKYKETTMETLEFKETMKVYHNQIKEILDITGCQIELKSCSNYSQKMQ